MIATFLNEWAFVIGVIAAFGTCGLGILAPFAGTSPYWFLGAPFAGLLIVPFGANTFYSHFLISYGASAGISGACCILLSIVSCFYYRARLSISVSSMTLGALGVMVGVVVVASVAIFEGATLHEQGPALLVAWGTDHFGYSHLADWLNNRLVSQRPQWLPTAERPYDSWPAIMFGTDPRFGSFGLVAIVSSLYGTSGMFAYDVASAVAVAAAVIALAALFANSTIVFALVAIGLLVSHWVDYLHMGFLGKVLGYPAALFVTGLTLKSLSSVSLDRVMALMILASATAILHSGPTTALLAGAVLIPALGIMILLRDRSPMYDAILMCCAVILIPVIASGAQARPTYFSFPDWFFGWPYVLPRIVDIESQIGVLSGLGSTALHVVLLIASVTWAGLLGLAVRQRSLCAMGLLTGPALLLSILFVLNLPAHAFQLVGYLYPALVCAAGSLAVGPWPWKHATLALLALAIAERGPRFVGAMKEFVVNPPQSYVFSKNEFDRMAVLVGRDGVVEVDIDEPRRAIAVLVEFGRREINVQWTGRAWKTILGYRPWPAPTYPVRAGFLLTLPDTTPRGEVLHQTARYKLARVN